jgi:hypothetical protein
MILKTVLILDETVRTNPTIVLQSGFCESHECFIYFVAKTIIVPCYIKIKNVFRRTMLSVTNESFLCSIYDGMRNIFR